MVGMVNNVQIFGGPHFRNVPWQKRQNLARFRTTFDSDREYLRNPSTYRKSETNLIKTNSITSCSDKKKLGELWFTNKELGLQVRMSVASFQEIIRGLSNSWGFSLCTVGLRTVFAALTLFQRYNLQRKNKIINLWPSVDPLNDAAGVDPP